MIERRTVETRRLHLDPVGPEHADPLWRATRSSLPQLRAWLPWAEAVTSQATREFCIEAVHQWEAGRGYAFVLSDGEIVGTMSVDVRGPEGRMGELGYWVRTDRTNRGYATEAGEGAIDFAFAELGLYRLELRAGVENRSSQRVAEKLGFRREGELRRGCPHGDSGYDCYLYGLLATDPLP